MDDLNKQAVDWCEGQTVDRPCPEDRVQPVHAVFTQE